MKGRFFTIQKRLYLIQPTVNGSFSGSGLDFWLCALHIFCQTCRHALTPVNLSTQSVCCCSELRLYLIFGWIMRWHRKSERAEEGRRRTVGWRGWYETRGMCTHSEVLLQRVSILLLQVEGREEGRGCNSNGNRERTHRQWDTGIHHRHSMQ